MARPLGIAPLTHLELTPARMVANAAACGYDFLGLRLIPATPAEPQSDCRPGTPMLRETLAMLADTGLRVVDVEIFRLQAQTVVADFEPWLAAAQQLGARHALAAPQDPDAARLTDKLAAFGELAARYGLGVDLEPTPWYDVSTLGASAGLIAAAGLQDAGLVLDPIHFDRAGEAPADLAQLDRRLFRYAQLCDAPAERPADLDTLLFQARAERMVPGEGGLPLAAIVRALPPKLPLSLEVPLQALSKTHDARARAALLLDRTRCWLQAIGG
jgi:sugar phosphate isomerase/epimerase